MPIGVDKTLAMFNSLGALSVDVISLVKTSGFSFGSLPKILDALTKINELAASAPAALPELMDLDAHECGLVGTAAYQLVQKIVSALHV